MGTQGVPSGKGRGSSLLVDQRNLSILDVVAVRDQLSQRIWRRPAGRQEVQSSRTKHGIGDVLRGNHAYSGARMRTSGGNTWAGRRDCDAEHSRTRATRRDRECHDAPPSSGMTAVTSISTTHSGRANADTTNPVEHGKTPFSHLPISW